MSQPGRTYLQRALLLAGLLLVSTFSAIADDKGYLANIIASRPGVKARREKLHSEETLKRGSHQHEHNSFFSCGTPVDKGVTRSYGRDQAKPTFEDNMCLETICDDPTYVLGYVDALQSGSVEHVTASVKVYSIGKDDNSEAFSDLEKSTFQKEVMDAHFQGTHIDFDFEDFVINSTYLWHGEVVPYGCPIQKVGDGNRDRNCLHAYNGYDGGDYLCLNPSSCNPLCALDLILDGVPGTEYCTCICVDYSECNDLIGNGVCDDKCNVAPANYDGGDCCLDPALGKCFDHRRKLFQRSFADIVELREHANSNFSTSLYIYVGSTESTSLLGISVFPWTIDFSQSSEGGFLMEKSVWGDGYDSTFHGTVAVHEAGHSFGLWHTFHGVTELQDDCSDACYEAQYPIGGKGTMLKGDLCSDTRPTPLNYACNDPEPCPADVYLLECMDCGFRPWSNTPLENVMGYSIPTGDCANKEFSPQQNARARCYYDLYYSDWDNSDLPGQIVIPPVVTRLSSNSVEVTWNPPLNKGSSGSTYYILRRSPSFEDGDIRVNATEYLDTNAADSARYSYMVKAANDAGEAPFFGKMQEEPKASDDDGSLSSGAIAGIVVGGTVGAVAVAGAAVFAVKRRKTQKALELSQLG